MKPATSRRILVATEDTSSADTATPLGARLARIVTVDEHGVPFVDFPGNPHGPLAARLALSAADASQLVTCWNEVDVLVVFVGQDLRQPLVSGIVRDSLEDCRRHVDEWIGFERLALRARDELALQCGEARLLLRSDGSVSIVGKEIVSRAKGRHRIRGGTVEIN